MSVKSKFFYIHPSALRAFIFWLTLFTLFRVLFFAIFAPSAEAFTFQEAFKAFVLGLRFDLRIALFASLPLLILRRFALWDWQNSPLALRRWLLAHTLISFLVLLTYAVDIGYYAYLQGRLNFRIFEYVINPLISLGMVWQSYNVILWLSVLIAATYCAYLLFKKFIFIPVPKRGPVSRFQTAIQTTLLVLLIILGLYGRVGQYPLRWSEAFFSQNMFISNLALNPIHYIFDTAKNSKRDYDVGKVKKYYPLVADYLGVLSPDAEKLNFQRPIPPTTRADLPRFPTTTNVVYIVMESMAAHKTGVFGNRPETSPSLDQVAKKGWLFRHFYVPTEGTARSMFCTLTGIPDINAKSTSSRNPLIINQNTLINSLKEHDKFYFIGGSANWGNIRGVYMNNIQNLKMYEDTDLDGPRTDVWGLSDLDLFRQTAKVLNARPTDKPFFALIQTASFHRPYTIPDEHGDFQIQNLSKEELARAGFTSNEEYNSFRFSDYSLGEFFRLIEGSPFYKNTLFIIHGDHGLPHNGAENINAGYKFFGLNRFHTPLVFYSPQMPKPQEFDNMMMQPDVWPTALALLNTTGTNSALGRNIFSLPPNSPQYAFSYVYYSDPLQIMLYDQQYLAFGTEKEIQSLHLYNSQDPQKDVKNEFPDKFKEMSDLLNGIFETSKYLLHHNPRLQN